MKNIFKCEEILKQELLTILDSHTGSKKSSSDFDIVLPLRIQKIGLKRAAIIVPITFEDKDPMVILTRRAKNLKEHPGQIAFPGGKVEEGDRSEMDTAIRECFEEIYLKAEDINVLGKLPNHETVTGYLISPFVAIIKNSQQLRPELSEVSEIFMVPLKFLLNKENMLIQNRNFNGCEISYYTIPYGPFYIWGATARIIKTFADLMKKNEKV